MTPTPWVSGSVFSGIGGFELGLARAGIPTLWGCEIDPNCRVIYNRHFSGAALYDDVRKIKGGAVPPVNLLVGGFPCQDLSTAGPRKGLAGSRSRLFFEFVRLIDEIRPDAFIIENVPGLLSSHQGKDFSLALGFLTGRLPRPPVEGWGNAGFFRGREYNVAYRILDSQFFGVAQKRRRIFIVGSLGNGSAAEILFDPQGPSRDPEPNPVQGENDSGLVGFSPFSHYHYTESDKAAPLQTPHQLSGSENLILYNIQTNDGGQHKRKDRPQGGVYITEVEKSLTVGAPLQTYVVKGPTIRRLTPLENERLQGFPEVSSNVTIVLCPIKTGDGKSENAPYAGMSSAVRRQELNRPADASVQINLERGHLLLLSQGKSLLPVNTAGSSDSSPLHIPTADFVRLVVHMLTTLDRITGPGRVESPQSTIPFTVLPDGRKFVSVSGQETAALVNDAEKFTKTVDACLRLTTSGVGSNSPGSAIDLVTLCCCVSAAISLSIPGLINPDSLFVIDLTTTEGWTYGQKDKVRYKQLANAVTVPVIEWLGRKLVEVRNLGPEQES